MPDARRRAGPHNVLGSLRRLRHRQRYRHRPHPNGRGRQSERPYGQQKAGALGPHAAAFNCDAFDPADPYTFVDDMTVNGLLLGKAHHTGKDVGIHDMPFPLWIAQKYAREGY